MSKRPQLGWLMAQAAPHSEQSVSGSSAGHPVQLRVLSSTTSVTCAWGTTRRALARYTISNVTPDLQGLCWVQKEASFSSAAFLNESLSDTQVPPTFASWHSAPGSAPGFVNSTKTPGTTKVQQQADLGALFGSLVVIFATFLCQWNLNGTNDTDLCNAWHGFLQHVSSLQKKFAV